MSGLATLNHMPALLLDFEMKIRIFPNSIDE